MHTRETNIKIIVLFLFRYCCFLLWHGPLPSEYQNQQPDPIPTIREKRYFFMNLSCLSGTKRAAGRQTFILDTFQRTPAPQTWTPFNRKGTNAQTNRYALI